jgi:hypothetical protein
MGCDPSAARRRAIGILLGQRFLLVRRCALFRRLFRLEPLKSLAPAPGLLFALGLSGP